ncbi:MAG: tRNA (guanosine(46)-N7)-methyltransferase TrmB [Campylobacterales bacterium]|nr:tRNA (guanosine(46)-N7)-methyltransferase TrmB [Campylobacterales bacterium]
MPHAFVGHIKDDLKPFSVGDFSFYDILDTKKYSLALVSMKDRHFALSIKQKEGLYLVKPEKITRPSELNITKEAIRLFCENCTDGIEKSNLTLTKQKAEPSNLLDPLYFCSHPEFFEGEVSVEVGFGSGRHLLWRAKEEPNKKFIGVEIYKPSIEQVAKQCEIQGIKNIYLVDFDARLLIETMPQSSLSEVYVHFPIPWPDSPTRRVISENFLRVCEKALKEDGHVELRSDDRDYFEYAFNSAMGIDGIRVDAYKNKGIEVTSKYEDRWLRQGKDIFEMQIYPRKNDKKQSKKVDFGFENEITLQNIQNLSRGAQISDNVLVSFEDIFTSRVGNGCAFKVTFGDPARPDRRYIVAKDGKASYYPFNPLCVEASGKAHKIIKECLYGTNS